MTGGESVKVCYFAQLREAAALNEEACAIDNGETGLSLYLRLAEKYLFTLRPNELRLAINEKFMPIEARLRSGDRVAFIPPVAGG